MNRDALGIGATSTRIRAMILVIDVTSDSEVVDYARRVISPDLLNGAYYIDVDARINSANIVSIDAR